MEASDLSFVILFLSTVLRMDCEGAFSYRSGETGYRNPTGMNEARDDDDLGQDHRREGHTA